MKRVAEIIGAVRQREHPLSAATSRSRCCPNALAEVALRDHAGPGWRRPTRSSKSRKRSAAARSLSLQTSVFPAPARRIPRRTRPMPRAPAVARKLPRRPENRAYRSGGVGCSFRIHQPPRPRWQQGEIDWWETAGPSILVPPLQDLSIRYTVAVKDRPRRNRLPAASIICCQPFNNVRRSRRVALLRRSIRRTSWRLVARRGTLADQDRCRAVCTGHADGQHRLAWMEITRGPKDINRIHGRPEEGAGGFWLQRRKDRHVPGGDDDLVDIGGGAGSRAICCHAIWLQRGSCRRWNGAPWCSAAPAGRRSTKAAGAYSIRGLGGFG